MTPEQVFAAIDAALKDREEWYDGKLKAIADPRMRALLQTRVWHTHTPSPLHLPPLLRSPPP